MHRSRLAGFIIDCRTDDVQQAAVFWSEALGMKTRALPPDEAQTYVRLEDPSGQLNIEVQAVDHDSRVHLDIETDDIDAEVRRLQALGARLVRPVKGWVVMEAPTGQRFCVVRASNPGFAANASSWCDDGKTTSENG